jgi:hypothetical protein
VVIGLQTNADHFFLCHGLFPPMFRRLFSRVSTTYGERIFLYA